ncbi:hypothetical protein [Streptomyces sp. NPDC055107]
MQTRWFDLANLSVSADGINTVDEPPAVTPSSVSASPAAAERPALERQPVATPVASAAEVPAHREIRPSTVRRLDSALYEESPAHVKVAMLSLENVIAYQELDADELAALRAAHARGQRWLDMRARQRRIVIDQLQGSVDAGGDPGGLVRQAWDLVRDEDAANDDKARVVAIQCEIQRVEKERLETKKRKKSEADRAAREAMQRAAYEHRVSLGQKTARKENLARTAQLQALVQSIRGGLKKAAGAGEMRTWSRLQHKTGARGLKSLSYEDRVDLLVMVGQKTPDDEPLWSVLLIAHGDQDAHAPCRLGTAGAAGCRDRHRAHRAADGRTCRAAPPSPVGAGWCRGPRVLAGTSARHQQRRGEGVPGAAVCAVRRLGPVAEGGLLVTLRDDSQGCQSDR